MESRRQSLLTETSNSWATSGRLFGINSRPLSNSTARTTPKQMAKPRLGTSHLETCCAALPVTNPNNETHLWLRSNSPTTSWLSDPLGFPFLLLFIPKHPTSQLISQPIPKKPFTHPAHLLKNSHSPIIKLLRLYKLQTITIRHMWTSTVGWKSSNKEIWLWFTCKRNVS